MTGAAARRLHSWWHHDAGAVCVNGLYIIMYDDCVAHAGCGQYGTVHVAPWECLGYETGH